MNGPRMTDTKRAKPKWDDQVAFATVAAAAQDHSPVAGWTHNFYRYPARFSPSFAAAAITAFSKSGDFVLDPYMGGGTAIVEGIAAGRKMIGNDLNSLAAFIAKVKVTKLDERDDAAIREWALNRVPQLNYYLPPLELAEFIDADKTRNLSMPKARFIKKLMAAALLTADEMPSRRAENFVRCALLCVAQWALDGRERHTSLSNFRQRLAVAL